MTQHARQVTTYVIVDWLSTSLAILLFNAFRYSIIPVARNFFTLWDYLGSTTVMIGQILFPLCMLVVYY